MLLEALGSWLVVYWSTCVALLRFHRGSFDSYWLRVFVDVPITNDSEALLQDRVLVLCCVGTRHYDVVVVFVAMDIGRYRVVGILEDSLNDVDALFVQKVFHGLDVVHMQSSLCGYADDVQEATLLCLGKWMRGLRIAPLV